MMNPDYLPWKILSATVGVGVLTDGWNLAAASEEDGETRSFVTAVTFASPFLSVPVLHVGLTGFDVDHVSSARLSLVPEDISPHGFQLRITTWRSSRIYSVEFSWMAMGA
ncbi:MAG: H-type lectin domain-containing protein [Verrucomicrobiales bacterium]|nr:H-type lectin domain-containing protein [Verrucomicrobiales bacterium]